MVNGMIMDSRKESVNAILEGVRSGKSVEPINEAALPKSVLDKMTKGQKENLARQIDLQNANIKKVNVGDEEFKNAHIRIYDMKDSYDGASKVIIAVDHNSYGKRRDYRIIYSDGRVSTSSDNSWLPEKGDKKHIKDVYVISKDDASKSRWDVSDKKDERRAAQYVVDPHNPGYNDVRDDEGNPITKYDISSKVGAKTREFKKKSIGVELEKICCKAGFDSRGESHSYDMEKDDIAGCNFAIESKSNNRDILNLSVIIDSNKKIRFKLDTSEFFLEEISRIEDAKEALDMIEEVRNALGDVIRLEKDLQKNRDIKNILSQI